MDPDMVMVWNYRDAPEEFKALSEFGGDETFVLACVDPGPSWDNVALDLYDVAERLTMMRADEDDMLFVRNHTSPDYPGVTLCVCVLHN